MLVSLTKDQLLNLCAACKVMSNHSERSSKDHKIFADLYLILKERLIIENLGPEVKIIHKKDLQ